MATSSDPLLDTPEPLTSDPLGAWMLDPEIDFLNHGSYGARLRAVWEAQIRWRERFESRPVEFLSRQWRDHLDRSKQALGALLGMESCDFGYTTNITESIASVLASIDFEPGDEVVSSDHLYNAVRQNLRHWVARRGATVHEIAIPLPCPSPEVVVDAFRDAIGDRTRLVVIDHVTSPTALRFPIERVVELCRDRGVEVLVDGAHAPGMLDLNIAEIDADYYAANLHKWLCAPPGCGMLWVRRDRQQTIHPCAVSHGFGGGVAAEFEWQGTRDPSGWLTVPDAIECMDALAGESSWPRIRAHNHALATWVQAHLSQVWQVAPNSPLDGPMLGSMASVTLPDRAMRRFDDPLHLQAALFDRHRIEVPCFEWNGLWLIRPCCNVYNRPEQYERLGEAVLAITA